MDYELRLRTATFNDDRQLAELDATAWPLDLQVSAPQPIDQPFFVPWRQPEDVIVADVDGVVLGYVRLGRHMPIEINNHVLHIHALLVSSAARGRGYGVRLVEAAINEANARGAAKLGLRALSTNVRALRLYEHCGFVEEARLKAELRRPDGTYADDVWMSQWIRSLPE